MELGTLVKAQMPRSLDVVVRFEPSASVSVTVAFGKTRPSGVSVRPETISPEPSV